MKTTTNVDDRGRLYVVATPIGNIEDFSARALRVLRTVDKIACENLRRTTVLLRQVDVEFRRQNLILLDDIHEDSGTDQVLKALQRGEDVALVSDAGTPLISDPGFEIVREIMRRGLKASPIPGASALTAVASISPIPLNEFTFIGFLRPRGESKKKQLSQFQGSMVPTVFFDTAKRILDTLDTFYDLGLSDRQLFIGRELTKVHEETFFGSVEQIRQKLMSRKLMQGEIVGVLAQSDKKVHDIDVDKLIALLLPHMNAASIASVIQEISSLSRKSAYDRVLELQRIKS